MVNIGLIGCGNIGSFIAKYIDGSKGIKLTSVFDLDHSKSLKLIRKLKHKPKICDSVDELINKSDFVVEAASQMVVRKFAVKIIEKGRDFLLKSVGALSDEKLLKKIKDTAARNKCFVYIPSVAVCGIHGIKSASIGKINKVTLTTTKNPKSFKDVKYLKDKHINLDQITKPKVLFNGSAKQAVALFPQNINVSTIISLVGVGVEKTQVVIVANPFVKNNIHEILMEGDFGKSYIRMENKPSKTNPKTSHLACLSAVQILNSLSERVRIGN